jgi:hypothetical protein
MFDEKIRMRNQVARHQRHIVAIRDRTRLLGT